MRSCESVLAEAREVALHAATDAAAIARHAFGDVQTFVTKSHSADLVTSIDIESEQCIVRHLRTRFPSHSILAEERGRYGGASDWLWLVDPLDGTSNYTLGLPLYGLTITLTYKSIAMLSVIMGSETGQCALAIRNEGVQFRKTKDGPFELLSGALLQKDVVALQQGYELPRDSKSLAVLRNDLESEFSRVLYTWAPSIDALMLLSGRIAAVVGVACRGLERAAWLLAASELGLSCVLGRKDKLGVAENFIASWPEVRERVTSAASSAFGSR